jgi:hypothetical protein
VAKSWVTFDPVTARYRLLEPLRQYLARRLDEADETESVQRAHATAVASLCDRFGTRLLDDQRSRSRRLREETGNIDLALQWALDHDQALAVRIAGALGQYWFFYDQASGRRRCELVIDAATDVAPLTRAMALLSVGMVAQMTENGTGLCLDCARHWTSIGPRVSSPGKHHRSSFSVWRWAARGIPSTVRARPRRRGASKKASACTNGSATGPGSAGVETS